MAFKLINLAMQGFILFLGEIVLLLRNFMVYTGIYLCKMRMIIHLNVSSDKC